MNWVIQNWPWVVLVLGALWLLRRWVSHGEQGRGHLRGDGAAAADLGPGGGVARVDEESTAQTSAPTLAIDAVTRKDVSPEHALTSIYRGRVYYFETAESRQRFEASPEQYARPALGYPLSSPQRAIEERRSRRRGC